MRPDTPAFPENGYGMAKLCAGQMSRELCAKLGIRHIWARILSVYGPCDGAKTMVMSSIRQLLAGESPAFTKGEQQWDYLYAKDAGRALYLLGEKGRAGSIYCLGSGQKRPLREQSLALGSWRMDPIRSWSCVRISPRSPGIRDLYRNIPLRRESGKPASGFWRIRKSLSDGKRG